MLYPYTKHGMYGKFFEGPCTLNINNNFIVLELEELKQKKDLQKIVLIGVDVSNFQANVFGQSFASEILRD